ncbi:hypothetical protein D9V86_07050 [Bacteroidetes/Chlorobi group bacterium ChocPot_Mid]|nr:MAG: hypothetical protein D9V86_07050 [Bacteroidetes/Chlorobi group bacterium ChocPot_Mid]
MTLQKFVLLLFVALMMVSGTKVTHAQSDSTFKPEGKMIIQVINRTLFEKQAENNTFGMYINRSHFGYSYQFSPEWSGAVVIDAGRPTIFGNLNVKDSTGQNLNSSYSYQQGSYYTMTLKFSYIEFKPTKDIKLQAGGILQNHYLTQEKFWGYRYILETFPDRYFSIPSGDLGFIGYFNINKWLSFDALLTNGEGFRNNQDVYGKVKMGVGVDFKPVDGLISRIYYDNSPSDNPIANANQQLYTVFIGYKLPKLFRLGAEYDYHKNHNHLLNNDLYGFSIYGSYILEENVELFGRYDNLRSNTLQGKSNEWNEQNDGDAIICGTHYSPVKGISLSLSYQGWKPVDTDLRYKNTVAFSFEYKL